MPTLFRLITVVGLAVALVYGAMFAIVTVFKPHPREIVVAVALPQAAAADLRMGRSAAETLNTQAAALVRHSHRRAHMGAE